MISRLSSIAPDLVQQLEDQPPERLRRVAASTVGLALAQTLLTDSRLDSALAALRNGAFGSSAELSGVQRLTDELDETAWDLQEMAEIGAASRQDYSAAFRRARAAASVGFALGAEALVATLECVYEAQAAVADLDAVRLAISTAIQLPPSAG